jgi:hypothetical protein
MIFFALLSDGFHVYELLKTTKDIITDLQEKVLDDVLPNHQKSIIQFYLRQIQTFNDVMADLGLFGLMQDILEMYKVIPRKKKATESPKKGPQPRVAKPVKVEEPDEGPEIVELDPDKKYNFRAAFTNGYIDPFSGTAPGTSGGDGKKDKDDGEGCGRDDDFIIYFDVKTGCIGIIPRKDCASKGLIVTQNDNGQEVMEGEIDDDDEKEKLIWDIKKAMKNKKGGAANSKSPGHNKKKYVITPRKDATGRTFGRSKNGNSNLKNLKVPCLDRENANETVVGRSQSGLKSMTKAVPEKDPLTQKKDPSPAAPLRRMSGQKEGTSKRASVQKKAPKPSSDGWSNATSVAVTHQNR